MTVTTFEAAIDDFAQKAGLNVVTVVKKLAFDSFYGLIVRSPVDTGRFRGNWRITLDRPDLRTTQKAPPHSAGTIHGEPPRAEELARPNNALSKIVPGADIDVYITNNLPYALKLENGHSRQSKHMLARTFAEARNNLQRALDSLK